MMRFSKRNRSPLLWGRRSRSEPENEDAPAQDGSQEPTPGNPGNSGTPEPSVPEPPGFSSQEEAESFDFDEGAEPMTSGDPTQRLLTVLGRFEREMLKGREGAPQEKWSDPAMQQLINAVEIAVEQGWRDMVEALTETGRILESYEKAGRANDCVPFLADSYEILCLMVGDLIVDKVRSGVMRKWRERYEMALEDIAAEGLTLVRDEEETGAAAAAPAPAESGATQAEPAPAQPAAETSPEPPAPEPVAPAPPQQEAAPEPVAEPAESPFDAVPEEPESEPELGDVPVLDLDGETEEPLSIASPWEEETAPPSETADEPAVHATPAASSSLEAEGFSFHKAETAPEPTDGEDEPEEEAETLSSVTVYTLDALAEALSRLKREEAESAPLTRAAIEENVSVLAEQAGQAGHADAVAACDQMRTLLSRAFDESGVPDDEFFELAYAFCGAFAESCEGDDMAGARWSTECEEYLRRGPAAEPEVACGDSEPPETGHDESTIEEAAAAAEGDPHEMDAWAEAAETHMPEPESSGAQPAQREVPAGGASSGGSKEPPEPARETGLGWPVSGAFAEAGAEEMNQTPAPAGDSETGGPHAEKPESTEPPAPSFEQADAREFVENTFQEALDVPAEEAPSAPAPAEAAEQLQGADVAAQAPAPEGAAAEHPGGGSAENLLASAVSAASSGNAAQAKTLALEAAARFARAQAEEADARVKAAEVRFEEGTRAIESAREDVEQAEKAVGEAEQETATARQRLDERTEQTAEIDGQLQEVDGRLEELDRQLRELQAKRDEVATEKQQVEERLDAMRSEMGEAQNGLDARTQKEGEARTALEKAREHLLEQQRKRAETENALEKARQLLSRQKASIAGIESTIEQILGSDADEDGGGPSF